MRKYVVPIVALAGIALLSPQANAANMIVKSRAIPQGNSGSLPVIVRDVSAGELWGVDLAVQFSTPSALAAGTFAETGAAFLPEAAGATGASPTDVVVSGTTFVGGGTQPSMYWGYVRGTAAIPTGATNGAGLMKVAVQAAAANGSVVNLAPVAYNVKNDGTGADVLRQAATGATSTATAGAPVNAEPITVLDYVPGATEPAAGAPDLRVPLHRVAVGRPGDLNANAGLDAGDLGNLAAVLVGKAAATWTEYKRVAADVAPPNGYSPTDIGGTAGAGYGDGLINAGDLGLLAARLVNKPSAVAVFPVPE